MGRRKKIENMGVKELVQEHRRRLDQAEADYKAAKDACADFYEDHVKPAMRREAEEKQQAKAAMLAVPRDLICKREQAQSKLNRARRKRQELLKDLADARRMQVKGKDSKSIVAEWKARETLVSREVKLLDDEIKSLDRDFRTADERISFILEEALAEK